MDRNLSRPERPTSARLLAAVATASAFFAVGLGTTATHASASGDSHPAKLKVLRAGVAEGRLDVLAEITKRSNGDGVRVSFIANGRRSTFTAPVKDGRIRFKRMLASPQRHMSTGIMEITYEGNERVRPTEVRLRAANGKALLERKVLSLKDGVITAGGGLAARADGVVRLILSYVRPDGTVGEWQGRAAIRKDGSWSLKEELPADAHAGGYLSIQFTGYLPNRVRGEQTAKQLLDEHSGDPAPAESAPGQSAVTEPVPTEPVAEEPVAEEPVAEEPVAERAASFGVSQPWRKLVTLPTAERDSALDQMVAQGATWVRFDFPASEMGTASSDPATWWWEKWDATVIAAKTRGLKVLGIPTTQPVWSRAAGATWVTGPTTASEREGYRYFAEQVASRYNGQSGKPFVDAWELWNEPNLDQFWGPTPSTSDYGALIAAAYPAVKAVTSATVNSGGTGWRGSAPDIDTTTWYQALHSAGANRYWDHLTVHPYQDLGWAKGGELFKGGEMGKVDALRTQMVAAGDSTKKIWGTEVGFPAQEVEDATHASFLQQADWWDDTFENWYDRDYTGPLFHYAQWDAVSSSGEYRGFGFYRDDRTTVKPVSAVAQAWAGDTSP